MLKMGNFNIAILGCGTVGSGVAKILLDMKDELSDRAGQPVVLKKIVDLFPVKSAASYNLPLNLFCGNGGDLTKEDAAKFICEVVNDKDIHLVVETIGGTSDYLLSVILDALKAKKHVVTANKAILAEKGKIIFDTAKENHVCLGYEASVCGAIPIIKAIRESFMGDKVEEVSGIMNGTSNYILSKMQEDAQDFSTALKMAQKAGYAEADPTLDIDGGDAGHKLAILITLAFGAEIRYEDLVIEGIQHITKEDLDFANEMGCTIKLVCYTKKLDGKIYASVKPMMVKYDHFLSRVNGATNCIQLKNKYSGTHLFVGKGAGSLETASSIVADIIFTARYDGQIRNITEPVKCELVGADQIEFAYNIIFRTEDYPGITGLVTTAIGEQKINIDTVSHNRHNKTKAYFSVVTMPCTSEQIKKAIIDIKHKAPNALIGEPKVIPVLN
jgi:homoserine dehydrogenase